MPPPSVRTAEVVDIDFEGFGASADRAAASGANEEALSLEVGIWVRILEREAGVQPANSATVSGR